RRAHALSFWQLPDRGVRPDADLVQRIAVAIDAQGADWLLAPSPFEVHPDHRATCVAAIQAASGATARRVRLGFYEVGQPLMPNGLLDISAVVARKRQAMRCFASQLAQQRYDEQIDGLNRYRAYTLGAGTTHAEAYWFPEADERAGVAATLRGLVKQLARRFGVQAMALAPAEPDLDPKKRTP
ncbi:MAG: hypothetical protein H7Z19_21475, partial [Chitinophagaceae bacterium]|nr:hypothetical protein [Rubrivivax sp.]